MHLVTTVYLFQIRHYAKFNDPKKIEVGTNVLTQAECYDNLDRDYLNSTKTRVYLSYCLCIPLIVITILVVVVRTLKVPITTKLSNSLNHPSVAGLVLTGIFLHLFCLAMDMAAVYYMHLDIELKDIPRNVDPHNSLNFFATGITLGFNILISFTLIVCSAYIHCKHILGPRRFFFRHVFQRVLSPIFYVVFGEFDQESFWKSTYKDEQERSDDDNRQIRRHTVWVVCFMLLAPLFSLVSHIGYIFAAWLTEPSKTTSVALIFLGITVFLFIVFRQCYIANEKVKVEKWFCNWFLLCRPCWQVLKCMCNCICLCLCMKTSKTFCRSFRKKKTPVNDLEEGEDEEETKEGKVETIDTILKENLESDHVFNTKSFCVTFAWDLPLVGSVAFFLSAFYELPIASYTLPLYLLNAFQVFLVIIALLITYKILNITEPVIHVFLRYLKKAYSERAQQLEVPEEGRVKMEGEEVASAATLIGELVGVVIHELQKFPTKKGGTENETQGKKACGAGGTQTQDQMQGKAHGAGDTQTQNQMRGKAHATGSMQMQEQTLGKRAHDTGGPQMTTEVERHDSHVRSAVSQASISDENTPLITKKV